VQLHTSPSPKPLGNSATSLPDTRLDRLARSTLDLLHTVDLITKAEAGFRSLADAWADTTTPHGKLMLTVLGGVAEFERSLIMSRTQAGIQRAKERGVAFGRPTNLSPKQRPQLKTFYATRVEEWFVEAETAEEARELLLSGAGHRTGIGECIHAEVEQIAE